MKAGDSFYIPANIPHAARSGPNGAKVLATYIVEKGKPLASPAP
jgi:quercetin dioxygenase-like cupin family protein